LGREFVRWRDLISFGVAPAFLGDRVVLHDVLPEEYAEIGWFSPRFISSAARSGWRGSTVFRAMNARRGQGFSGLSDSVAAGLVASLTLVIIKN